MPNLEETRYDMDARREALSLARQLPEAHLAEVVRVQREESRQATARQREQWEEDWRLYQSNVDWSDKEDWQSQVWVPMPFSAVEQATAIIQRSMLDSPEFFGVEGQSRYARLLAAKVWKPLLALAFNKIGFIPKFADAVKMALSVGISLYLKYRWHAYSLPVVQDLYQDPATGEVLPVYQSQAKSFLAIDTVPPWNVYRDPDSKPREQFSGSYVVHEEWVDQAFLERGRRAGYYRGVERIREGGSSQLQSGGTSLEQQARRKGMTWEKNKFRKVYQAREWWGDLPDQNGDVILADAHIIVVNDVVVWGPTESALWAVDPQSGRRKWPLIGFTPLQHPLRFEGFGILSAVTPLAALFSNLFNLYMDGMNWSVNPPTEVDLELLEDWDDLEHIPGRLWIKRGQGQALTPAQVGRIDHAAVLTALQFIHQQFENESFVTAFISGLPGYRSNITKGEVQIKTQQSMGIFEGIARNLESGGVAAVEMAQNFLLQYLMDLDDPAIIEILTPDNANLLLRSSLKERMDLLGGEFNYTFTGVSATIHKADLLGRLLQAGALATQGVYAGLTNPSQVLSAIVEVMGLRDRIEVYDRKMVPQAEFEAMLAKMTGGEAGRPAVAGLAEAAAATAGVG